MPDQPDDWHVIIPMENLKIAMPSLKIGPVKLVRFTKNRASRLRRIERGMFVGNPHYPQDRKSIVRLTAPMNQIIKDWTERTCAEIIVHGGLEDIRNNALNLVQEALNVIKLYRYHNDDFYSRYFGVPGTVVPNVMRNTVGFNTSQSRVNLSSSIIGHSSPFEIDGDRIQFMRRRGFAEVSKLVGKKNRNQIEERVLAAVHWFAKAFDVAIAEHLHARPFEEVGGFTIKGIHPDSMTFFDRFIKLMVCSETLFVLGRDEPLRSTISERAALLLGKNYAQRRDIKRFFQNMYDKRSDLVHGRKLSLHADELSTLVLYLQSAIIVLVKRKKRMRLFTDADLREWFERKRLGG